MLFRSPPPGFPLPLTPKHNATLWTTYNITREWQVGGGATYMSSRFLNNTDLVSVPQYTRLDATLAYRRGGQTLAVATLGRDKVCLEAEAAFERNDQAALGAFGLRS